jgi:hypothetical protein
VAQLVVVDQVLVDQRDPVERCPTSVTTSRPISSGMRWSMKHPAKPIDQADRPRRPAQKQSTAV